MIRIVAALLLYLGMAFSAQAQERFWVQIEARQTLSDAQERARAYASTLDNVKGFYLGSGYYGILIGPFDKVQAQSTLARLLARRAVPGDSFVRNDRFLELQFWPVGDSIQDALAPPPSVTVPAPSTNPNAPALLPDETPQQARATEGALSDAQRQDLQRALQWEGFYDAAIDGAFGRGTRAAMQAWQTANDLAPTGVLTTRQRARLMADYDSVLEGMNLRPQRDDAAGIEMLIPSGVVAFSEYRPPFVRFDASGQLPQAKVLFISQAGDSGTLIGLYEVLQTLDIVPADGPRALTTEGFEIEGEGNGIHSYTTATLKDGAIKGFMLVWPAGDNPRRERVLADMRASFQRLDGVLDPGIVPPGEDQSIDMVAGLAVRQPRLSRSGFYVSGDGAVITTTQAVQDCERITYDRTHEAQLAFADADLGIALLRPLAELVPLGVAAFQTGMPRLQDRVAVAGYPFDGALGAPTLTFGRIADIRDLTGDVRLSRLAIPVRPSDTGGPIFDRGGAILGMLLPRTDDADHLLPPQVHFALDAEQIVAALASQGITAQRSMASGAVTPAALTQQAADTAVLVDCW